MKRWTDTHIYLHKNRLTDKNLRTNGDMTNPYCVIHKFTEQSYTLVSKLQISKYEYIVHVCMYICIYVYMHTSHCEFQQKISRCVSMYI